MAMKAFIASEFGYWSLVWNFHCRKLNSQVKKLHERALRIVYQYFAFSFTELLEKKKSPIIRNRNIQLYPIVLCKAKNGLSTPFMNEISMYNANPHDLRKKTKFKRHNFKTVYKGIETLSSL